MLFGQLLFALNYEGNFNPSRDAHFLSDDVTKNHLVVPLLMLWYDAPVGITTTYDLEDVGSLAGDFL